MPVILAAWEAEIGRIGIRGQPGKIVLKTPISKITRAKWTGDMSQSVQPMLCALSSKNKTKRLRIC
jgi:hypothetical protein